jgi:hypothetical protein
MMMSNRRANWLWTVALLVAIALTGCSPNPPTPLPDLGAVAPASPAPRAPVILTPTNAPYTGPCAVINGRADLRCTPGAHNPAVTESTLDTTICKPGWTKTVRPPSSYTTKLKDEQKVRYGLGSVPNAELEEDHLIPLSLGGAVADPRNLWPEPRSGPRGAQAKNNMANDLHRAVCTRAIRLPDARAAMLQDWTHP